MHDFKTVYTLLANAMADGRSEKQLNTNEWSTLRSYATNDQSPAGAVAKGLLLKYKKEYYPTIPPKAKIELKKEKDASTDSVAVSQFALYPNPNDGNAVIQYSLQNAGKPATIVITDVMGNTIATYPVSASYGQVNISQTNLAEGVYLCILMHDDKRIGVQKFVKF